MRRHLHFLRILAYGTLFAFSLFLLFHGLDNRPLWGDEAETALLAKNVLRFGIPKTVDGVNHITVLGDLRDENAAHVWTWAPWLPEYLVAGVYRLFGENTWASRAPFTALGWLSVILLAHVSYRIYRDHRVALASAFLLTTSEIFLLQSRQCRYYSITVLAEVLLVYGASELLRNRPQAIWFLVSALTLQFYTNFIVAAANIPLLIALSWFARRQRQALIKVAITAGLLALMALPWLVYARTWQQSRELIHEDLAARDLVPGTHLVDSGYVVADVLVSAQTHHQIDVVGPPLSSSSRQQRDGHGYDLHAFGIDWEAQQAQCPQGQRSVKWTPGRSQTGESVIRIRFDRATCRACPTRQACTSSPEAPRQLTVKPQVYHEALQAARQRQETPEFRAQYALRAGVESTLSQAVRRFDLRQSRYIGLARTHLQQVLTATAMNVVRVIAWLRGQLLGDKKRPGGRFARLAPDLLATEALAAAGVT